MAVAPPRRPVPIREAEEVKPGALPPLLFSYSFPRQLVHTRPDVWTTWETEGLSLRIAALLTNPPPH